MRICRDRASNINVLVVSPMISLPAAPIVSVALLVLSLSLLSLTALPVAAETWQELKQLGVLAESRDDLNKSAQYFERALTLLPRDDYKNRLEIEYSLIDNYKLLQQLDPMFKHLETFQSNLMAMQKLPDCKGDPRTDETIAQVIGICDGGMKTPNNYKNRTSVGLRLCETAVCISEIAFKSGASPQRRSNLARAYLAVNRKEMALAQMDKLLQRLPADHKLRLQYQLQRACVYAKQGKPAEREKLFEIMKKSQGVVYASESLGRAQLWALDYPGSIATLQKALATANLSKAEKVQLLKTLSNSQADCGQYVDCEKTLRQMSVILANDKQNAEYGPTMRSWSQILTKLNRKAEADQVYKRGLSDAGDADGEADFFVTEKDRAKIKAGATK